MCELALKFDVLVLVFMVFSLMFVFLEGGHYICVLCDQHYYLLHRLYKVGYHLSCWLILCDSVTLEGLLNDVYQRMNQQLSSTQSPMFTSLFIL